VEDSYDFASAIKDVDRQMPKAGKEIREYINKLKAKLPQEIDPTAEKGA
jgi:hypothetical protein